MIGSGRQEQETRSAGDQIFALIPIGLFVLFFYLLYRIISPFLGSIAWALILGILFAPVHGRLLALLRGRRRWGALIMTLLVILIIVIPGTFLSVVLARQAAHGISVVADTIGHLKESSTGGLPHSLFVQRIQHAIATYVDLDKIDVSGALLDTLKNLSAKALDRSTAILGNVAKLVFSLFIMLFTLYYVFKDGGTAMSYVERIHPMIRQTGLFQRLQELTVTTFYAGFVVAFVQGALAGVAFAVLGLPSPFFWGAITALMSFVPLVGAVSIWAPAALWFGMHGEWGRAIGLAIWGTAVVSAADNVLKPTLISGRMNLHPLLVFLSVLGGLSLFGPLGVILGPLVLVLCLGLLDSMTIGPKSAGD
jgi:predicted PurR-regulated permease PerM